MKRRAWRALAVGQLVLALTVLPALAHADSSYNGHALTPPMGFNTWNAFACNINEDLVKSTALAMKNNGMQDAGYRYVNLDDCWQDGRTGAQPLKPLIGRDAQGHVRSDPTNFPSGMKSLADYVHSLGLKFGLYSSNGTGTCQNVAGQLGHETMDAQDYASWGVDYLKLDTCNSGLPWDPKAFYTRYKVMSDALLATGRDIVFSLCDFTQGGQTWLWGAQIGNLWRTTGDISASFNSMLNNFTSSQTRATYAGPGHWNDPDMLEIGTGGFSNLAAPARVGDTNVQVVNSGSSVVGSAFRVGTLAGGDLESAIVTTNGTAAGAATALFAPAAAGDTNVKVASASGFTVGNKLLLDTDGTYESPTITAVGTAGTATTLADATSAGATKVRVASVNNLAPGDKLTFDDAGAAESATVDTVGTAAGAGTTLAAPAAAGATNVKVASLAGLAVGDPLLIDSGSGAERATVTSLGSAASAATTIVDKAAAGDTNVKLAGTNTTLSAASVVGATNVKVASVTNLAAGNKLTVDQGTNQETGTIATVGTAGATGTGVTLTAPLAAAHASGVPAITLGGYTVGDGLVLDSGDATETVTIQSLGTPAGAATTTVAPTFVGDTNVKVSSITGFAVGNQAILHEPAAVPLGTPVESVKITGVGTAAGAQTTTVTPAKAGDTNIKVASVSGFTVGQPLQIMLSDGSNFETATVNAIGTAAGAATTLASAAAIGDTVVKVTSVTGFVAGQGLVVGVGNTEETATIASVGTAGATGTGVTLTAPLAKDHLILMQVRGTGTGLDISPLARAHASGSSTRGQGTGITVEPLKVAHPLATTGASPGGGISIRDAGTGITVAPLAKAHTISVSARDAGTGVGVSALTAAHASGVAARGLGSGVTLTAALAGAHPVSAPVRDETKPGTGITFSPALTAAHTVGAVTRGGGTGITVATPLTMAHANNAAIGKSGMSITESKTHFALWSMAAAPLLAGTDVVNMAKENLAIYLNKDLIAIDQDTLGVQASTISNAGGQWKLARPLANGDRAVALFNANAGDWLAASADFASVGLDPATKYLAKDLETKAITAMSDNVTVADLPAHATTVYRLSDDPPTMTVPTNAGAKSVGDNGIAVDYAVTATDALGGSLTPSCLPASGSLFPIGPSTVSCTATDAAGRSVTKSFVVQVAPPDHPVVVGGNVPATLSLVLGAPATFGSVHTGRGEGLHGHDDGQRHLHRR